MGNLVDVQQGTGQYSDICIHSGIIAGRLLFLSSGTAAAINKKIILNKQHVSTNVHKKMKQRRGCSELKFKY